jgi:hypothetical protein
MSHLNVSDAAREIGARPRDISALLYNRELSDESCPIVNGRRMIPRELLPTIREKLTAKGKLPQVAEACAS